MNDQTMIIDQKVADGSKAGTAMPLP